ncbi:MAG: HEPN domain-containing protein [Dehalococcoidia bacterium]|nr:HEPN domain-containing protein [Dehalococcoidia bacterium]
MRREIADLIDGAWYDYASAEDMLRAGRYNYVAFLCQQAVEKRLKEKIRKLGILRQEAEAGGEDGPSYPLWQRAPGGRGARGVSLRSGQARVRAGLESPAYPDWIAGLGRAEIESPAYPSWIVGPF